MMTKQNPSPPPHSTFSSARVLSRPSAADATHKVDFASGRCGSFQSGIRCFLGAPAARLEVESKGPEREQSVIVSFNGGAPLSLRKSSKKEGQEVQCRRERRRSAR